jgi:predicted membrane channel-forming protein YqfA (hemolysin III family)
LAWHGGGGAADRPYSPHLVPYENAVLRVFLLAAAGCLLLSACYHAGNCSRDEAHCSTLLRLDASGVAVLIAASFLPGVRDFQVS